MLNKKYTPRIKIWGFAVVVFLTALYLFVYPLRLKPVESLSLKFLTGHVNKDISFSGLYLARFNSIVIRNVAVADVFKCNEIVIYINPVRIIQSVVRPQLPFNNIKLIKPFINLSKAAAFTIPETRNNKSNIVNELNILIENLEIEKGVSKISNIDGIINYHNDNYDIKLKKNDSDVKFEIKKINHQYLFSGFVDVKERNISGLINLNGQVYPEKKMLVLDASLPVFDIFGLNFSNTVCKVNSLSGGVNVSVVNSAGSIDYKNKNIKCNMDFSRISSEVKGIITASENDKNKDVTEVSIKGAGYKGIFLNDIKIVWIKGKGFKANIPESGLYFNGNISKDEVKVDIVSRNKPVGIITGTMSPFEINSDIKALSIQDFISKKESLKQFEGVVSLKGCIKPDLQNLKASINNLKYAGNGKTDKSYFLSILNRKNIFGLIAYSLNGEWVLKYSKINENIINYSASLSGFDIQSNLRMIGVNKGISGKLSGGFGYSSTGKIVCDISVNELNGGGIAGGNGKISFHYSNESVKLNSFYLNCDTGSIRVSGTIDEGSSRKTNLDVRCDNFPFFMQRFDGHIIVDGRVERKQSKRDFSGLVKSEGFRINNESYGELRSRIFISDDKINIYDIMFGKYIRGKLYVDRYRNDVKGMLKLVKIPLSLINKNVAGILDGDIGISGKTINPGFKANLKASGCRYESITFTAGGAVTKENKKYYLNNIDIYSDMGSVSVNGQISPILGLNLKCNNLDLGGFKKVFGNKIQYLNKTNLKGKIDGTVYMNGFARNPRLDVRIKASDLVLYNKKIDKVETRFVFDGNVVRTNNLYIKYADSEISIKKESYLDILKKEYSVDFNLNNFKAGIVELFGDVNSKGKWQTDGKKQIRFMLSSDKLWLNRFSAGKVAFGAVYDGNTVVIFPHDKSIIKISGKIKNNVKNRFDFEKISVKNGLGTSLTADGMIENNKYSLNVEGTKLDCESVVDILGAELPLEGSMNVKLSLSNTGPEPDLNCTASLVNGKAAYLPFDYINLKMAAKDKYLFVENMKIAQNQVYSINITGKLPFVLSAKDYKKMKNVPISLEANMSNGSMKIFKEMTDMIKDASGLIDAKVSVSGTYQKPELNGYLEIKNAEILSNRYFNKAKNLSAFMTLKNNKLKVDRFEGKIGKGVFELTGNIGFSNFKPKRIDLNWKSVSKKGISIYAPELPIPSSLFKAENISPFKNYSSGDPKYDIRLSGTPDKLLLSGWVQLDNTHFTYPSIVPSGPDDPLENIWPRISWDLSLKSGENTWYESELASVNVQGGIRLTGSGKYPTVDGKADAVRGSISYLGTDFKIINASLEIINNEVYLQGESESEVYDSSISDYDKITLKIDRAKLMEIKPQFISKNNTNLSSEKAMLKATGINSLDSESSANVRRQLVRFLDSTLATPIAKTLLVKTGIADTFKVNYSNTEGVVNSKSVIPREQHSSAIDALVGTKYSMEKSLTNKMLLGYSVTLDEIQNKIDLRHSLQLSYKVNKNLFLKGYYEIDAHNAIRQFDKKVTLEQQWRFGLPGFGKKKNMKN